MATYPMEDSLTDDHIARFSPSLENTGRTRVITWGPSSGWLTHDHNIEPFTLDTWIKPPDVTVTRFCPIWARHVYSFKEWNAFNTHPPQPGYKALVKSGAYIWHKFHRARYISNPNPIVTAPSIFFSSLDLVFTTNIRPEWQYPWWTLEPIFLESRNHAIRNLYGSLGRRRRLQVGVMLGELKETLGLLGSTIMELIDIFNAVRRGRIRDALSILRRRGVRNLPSKYPSRKAVNARRAALDQPPLSKSDYAANAWLELQFGWMPLVSDIYDIIAYVQDVLQDPAKSKWMSFKGYDTRNDKQVTRVELPGFQNTFKCFADLEVTREVRTCVTATFTLSSESIDFLTSLGLDNPLSIAWNLLPLSFVIDWLAPIGDWLDSFTAHAGLELLEYTPSIKVVEFHKWSNFEVLFNYNGELLPTDQYSIPKTVREGYAEEFVRAPRWYHDLPAFPHKATTFEELLDPWILITASALIKRLRGSH